jgi:excisionase family DNA binding protein
LKGKGMIEQQTKDFRKENVRYMENQISQLVDVEYPMQRFGISQQRAYDLCRQGILPHIKIGRHYRFNPDAIEQWIAKGGKGLEGK